MTVIALFVIVVAGMLAGALIKTISAASNTMLHQVYGIRAQQAAQAGVQSLLQSSFPVGATPVACNQTVTSPAAFSAVNGLANCSFQARCTSKTVQFGNIDHLVYRFSSTGACTVDTDVVSRTISVDSVQELSP
ncbi:type II secretory pathway component [Glaciecola sp. 2405UD65-10]|uniref:type II secretory pathway component n=1 Tax=Glaciecola sp. 2405UD65-10 TaxID=3397244 RepID=UPI003B593B02